MVMHSCTLHLELSAGVFGTACGQGVQAGDVNLDEVVGCQLFKSGPSPLCSARFHRSPSFFSLDDSYCNVTDVTAIVVIKDNGRVI